MNNTWTDVTKWIMAYPFLLQNGLWLLFFLHCSPKRCSYGEEKAAGKGEKICSTKAVRKWFIESKPLSCQKCPQETWDFSLKLYAKPGPTKLTSTKQVKVYLTVSVE